MSALEADSPEQDLVAGLVRMAAARGASVSPRDLLDLLWLASHLPSGGRFEIQAASSSDPPLLEEPIPKVDAPRVAVDNASDQPAPPEDPDDVPEDDDDDDEPVGSDDPKIPLLQNSNERTAHAGARGGLTIALPAPAAIPDKRAFLQTWRPLMLRGPSRVRRRVDVAATARLWSDEGVRDVVLRPARERQVDLLLALDFSPSMDMWRGLMREAADAFRKCGGFRTVQVVRLVADPQGDVGLARLRGGGAPAAKRGFDPSAASRRRLCLVLTDCTSAPWRGAACADLLEGWAKHAATAILQVLPERLWARTALGRAERVSASASGSLAPNRSYRVASDRDEAMAMLFAAGGFERAAASKPRTAPFACSPLLHQDGAARIVRFLGGRANEPISCLRLSPAPSGGTARDLKPLEALEAFGRQASRNARDLAALLAASPAASLPIARILREKMLGFRGQPVYEAEIWTSGLLEPLEDLKGEDPEDALYRFKEGIQEVLLGGAPRSLRQQVLETTSAYLEENLGRLPGFRAMLAAPEEHPGRLAAGAVSDPMIWIAAKALRRQGGDLARLVDSYEGLQKPPAELALRAARHLFTDGSPCHRFAWSPAGDLLAFPTRGGDLVVTSYEQAGLTRSVKVSRSGVNQAVWSPDAAQIAVACFSRVVRIFDSIALKRIHQLEGHNSDVTAVAYGPGGTILASGTAGGTVRIWDLSKEAAEPAAVRSGAAFGGVRALLWLDAATLAVGYKTRTLIYRYSSSGLEEEAALDAGGTALAVVRPSRTGWLAAARHLVSGQPNGEIQFWHARTWTLARSLYPHRGTVTAIDVSRDDRLVASKARDGSVCLLRIRTGRAVGTLKSTASSSPYGHLAFRPSDASLAIANSESVDDQNVVLYNLEPFIRRTGRSLRVLVVGSDKGASNFAEVCGEIGRELAIRGHALAIRSLGRYSAEHYAFVGYARRAWRGGRVIFASQDEVRRDEVQEAAHRLLSEAAGSTPDRFDLEVAEALFEAFSHHSAALRELVSTVIPPSELLASAGPLASLASLQFLVAVARFRDRLPTLLKEASSRLPGNDRLTALCDRSMGGPKDLEVSIETAAGRGEDLASNAELLRGMHAVVAVGGGRGTSTALRLALGFGLPVMPLAACGGAAAKFATEESTRRVWRRRCGNDAEFDEMQRLCGPTWGANWARRVVERLEAAVRRPDPFVEDPLRFVVRIEACEPQTGQPWTTGLLVGPRTVLTAAKVFDRMGGGNERARATAYLGTEARSSEGVVHRPWRTATDHPAGDRLCFLRLDSPLVDENWFPIFESGAEPHFKIGLLGSPVRLLSAGESLPNGLCGVVIRQETESIGVWSEQPLPPGGAGGPVVMDGPKGCTVVGLVVYLSDHSTAPVQALRFSESMVRDLQNLSREDSTGSSPPKSPLRWVGVVGTSAFDLASTEVEAARAVGRTLADLSYGLITGGRQGVDFFAAQAFHDRLSEHKMPVDDFLVHIKTGGGSDYPHGRIERRTSETAAIRGSVAESVAIVVIGGVRGAYAIAQEALRQRVPVLPLLGTGGDADRLHEEIMQSWPDRPQLPVSAEDFKRATTWGTDSTALLQKLLLALL